jgi:hypothetical protein
LTSHLGRQKGQVAIFLHIPKSGGMTVYDILNREYGRSHIYTFSGGRHRLQHDVDKFKALSIQERNSFSLLRGHNPFGIHKLLQTHFSYITILRDPIARVVSHYYYVLNNPHHLLHENVVSANMSLETYVSSGINYEMDNGQTRQIAGVSEEISFGMCSGDLLNQAIENIARSFSVVGLTERFDETLLLMKHVLGWKSYPVYTRQNVSKNKQSKGTLSEDTRQLIAQYNQLDLELYEYATQLFADQLTLLPDEELKKFYKINRVYTPFGNLLSFSRNGLRRIRQSFT